MSLLRWNMLNQPNSFVSTVVSKDDKVYYLVCVYDSELKVRYTASSLPSTSHLASHLIFGLFIGNISPLF